jgi:hypothetical protein
MHAIAISSRLRTSPSNSLAHDVRYRRVDLPLWLKVTNKRPSRGEISKLDLVREGRVEVD